MLFLFKLVNGEIISPLIEFLNFYFPLRQTRKPALFKPSVSRINVYKYSPLNRMQNMFNDLSFINKTLDLNYNTFNSFKCIVNNAASDF